MLYDREEAEAVHRLWEEHFNLKGSPSRLTIATHIIYLFTCYIHDLKKEVELAECDRITLPGILIGLLIGGLIFGAFLFVGRP
jgi:hypothetical protein